MSTPDHDLLAQLGRSLFKGRKRRLTYTFRCPVCGKVFQYDEPGSPCCTGPSESADEHEMVPMHLVQMEKIEVNQEFAVERVEGRLLTADPELQEAIEQDAGRIILAHR